MNIEFPMVYISYKHYDNCKNPATKEKYTKCLSNIINGLVKIQATYSIDSQSIKYKDSIKSFEEEIGKGLIIIAIITPEYLKSVGCMYELAQVFENGSIYNRLFPVVDIDRSLDSQNDVITFWERQIVNLKKEALAHPHIFESFTTEITKVELILKYLGSILKYLCDRNADSMERLTENDAQKLMEEISNLNSMTSASTVKKAITTDQSTTQNKENAPYTSIVQNGAHSIGVINGDVTINFGQ